MCYAIMFKQQNCVLPEILCTNKVRIYTTLVITQRTIPIPAYAPQNLVQCRLEADKSSPFGKVAMSKPSSRQQFCY